MGLSKPSVCTDTRTPHSRAVFPTVHLSKSRLLLHRAARERRSSGDPLRNQQGEILSVRLPPRQAAGYKSCGEMLSTNAHASTCALRLPPSPSPPYQGPTCHPLKTRSAAPRRRRHACPHSPALSPHARQPPARLPHGRPRRHHIVHHHDQTRWPSLVRHQSPSPATSEPHASRHVPSPRRLRQRRLRGAVRSLKPSLDPCANLIRDPIGHRGRMINATHESSPSRRGHRHHHDVAPRRTRRLHPLRDRSAQHAPEIPTQAPGSRELDLEHHVSQEALMLAQSHDSVPCQRPPATVAATRLAGRGVRRVERLFITRRAAASAAVGRGCVRAPPGLANHVRQRGPLEPQPRPLDVQQVISPRRGLPGRLGKLPTLQSPRDSHLARGRRWRPAKRIL